MRRIEVNEVIEVKRMMYVVVFVKYMYVVFKISFFLIKYVNIVSLVSSYIINGSIF